MTAAAALISKQREEVSRGVPSPLQVSFVISFMPI